MLYGKHGVFFGFFSRKRLELFLGGGHVIKLASDGGLYPSFLRVLIPSLYIGKGAVFFLIPIHGRFSGSSFLDGFGGGLHHLFFLRSSSSSSEESESESLSELQLQSGSHTDQSTSHKKCPFNLSENIAFPFCWKDWTGIFLSLSPRVIIMVWKTGGVPLESSFLHLNVVLTLPSTEFLLKVASVDIRGFSFFLKFS